MYFIYLGIGSNKGHKLLFSQIMDPGTFYLFFEAPDYRSRQHNITY